MTRIAKVKQKQIGHEELKPNQMKQSLPHSFQNHSPCESEDSLDSPQPCVVDHCFRGFRILSSTAHSTFVPSCQQSKKSEAQQIFSGVMTPLTRVLWARYLTVVGDPFLSLSLVVLWMTQQESLLCGRQAKIFCGQHREID